MPRATIDYGIDLGTTNSCIALFKATEVEVIRNNEGFEYTPSAVWIDRKDRLHVGRRAREQYEVDEENACLEFKLQMGKTTEKVFQRNSRRMKPEELSAEVLKSLVGDVHQRLGESIDAAVITVPADFDLPQCDATRRAAELAGLRVSPLLQEPVAAALAYGFQSSSDRVCWFVYDLGGGTFDAAVIQMRDGLFRVVNHGGDRHLGGKLIDWAIVEQLLVPALTRQHPLDDFRRGNPRWRAAFAKLKLAAEQAKIRLSRDAAVEVVVEFPDGHGATVPFEHDLQRKDVEALIEPFVLRTINIGKKVLADKRLGPGDIQKLLLVGGPTLTPYLRERLADPIHGLGIPLEAGLDPMTVVARGAAIFAGTNRREDAPAPAPAAAGEYTVALEYQAVGNDPEPLVGGRVQAAAGQTVAGFAIEFVDGNAKPPRRSGKLTLDADGTFMTNLWAAPGQLNTYVIELSDPAGRLWPTTPDRLTYTLGLVAGDVPLTHSVGVAMANNAMDVFLPKGSSLPARKRVVHRTALALRKGQGGDLIRIPVVEGENARRADRNRLIGSLEIAAREITRDVPAGSEIEITIEIDVSRLLRTKAYIPLLDEEFVNVIKLEIMDAVLDELQRELAREARRLQEARDKARQVRDDRALRVLQRIDKERMEQDAAGSLAAAAHDPDAADKCQNRLLDLKSALDEAEDALRWPAMVADVEQQISSMREVVDDHGKPADKQQAAALEREARAALTARDGDLLQRKLHEMSNLRFRILREVPGYWVSYLGYLDERRSAMTDPVLAEQLTRRARRAMDDNDLPALRAAVQQLAGLLPEDEQVSLKGYGGTTLR